MSDIDVTDEVWIAQQLRRLAVDLDIPMTELAKRTGIAYRTLQDYLSGASKPQYTQLKKLAAVGMDVGFLITRSDSRLYLSGFARDLGKASQIFLNDTQLAGVLYNELLALVASQIELSAREAVSSNIIRSILNRAYSYRNEALRVVSELQPQINGAKRVGATDSAIIKMIIEQISRNLDTA